MKKITRKSAKHLVERKIMRIFAHKNTGLILIHSSEKEEKNKK